MVVFVVAVVVIGSLVVIAHPAFAQSQPELVHGSFKVGETGKRYYILTLLQTLALLIASTLAFHLLVARRRRH